MFGIRYDPPLMSIILPVGLSFHTFQAMSYTIEVYRRKVPAEKNLLQYALYVAFFPQMVAGPIERPTSCCHSFIANPGSAWLVFNQESSRPRGVSLRRS